MSFMRTVIRIEAIRANTTCGGSSEPPDIADDPLIALLKFSLLILKDTVDTSLRECWPSFPCGQGGKR